MPLPVNAILQGGKYKIVRHLSSGGFGVTYEAEHTLLHHRVAIKEFFVKDFCNRDEQTNRVTVATQGKAKLVERLKKKFVDEASAIFSLSHPNIVHVFDVFEENDTAYYVMDFISGLSLQQIVKQRGPLPEAEAVGYIRQVADALSYIHARNRLHLDIKPGNIMVNNDGQAILIDFGASKQYDEVDGENTSTLTGKTPGFAPLEQMSNTVRTFSPSTDIYSLGATLYKLLTGITPPNASDIAEDPSVLLPLPATISPTVRHAVEQSMQLARKNRPQNIAEFLAVLGEGNTQDDATLVEEDSLVEKEEFTEGKQDGSTNSNLGRIIAFIKSKKIAIGITSIVILLLFAISYFRNKNSYIDKNTEVKTTDSILADSSAADTPKTSNSEKKNSDDLQTRTTSEYVQADDVTNYASTSQETKTEKEEVTRAKYLPSKNSSEEAGAIDNSLVEIPARYPGGEAALIAFINKNVEYPLVAVEQELQGTVILRFKVNVDGSVGSIKIEKSLSKECDKAASDAVRKLKRFVPAKQQGHPVPVWFRIPVKFTIQ